MNPQFRTVALAAASLGLLLSLFLALRPGDATSPAADRPVRIALRLAPESTIYRGSVKQGRKVVIVVRSTVAGHAHLHGYELEADVAPGKPGQIEFTASLPGRFEIELEDRHQLLGVLEVLH